MTSGRGTTIADGEREMPKDTREDLPRRRRAARRTALMLALAALAIYLGFYLLEAYR